MIKATACSGDQTEQLCTMNKVEKYHLIENQTFKSKEVIQLRISEEANLHTIATVVDQSDHHTNLTAIGLNFYGDATFSEKVGWTNQSAICREGDDILKIPHNDKLDASIVNKRKIALHKPIKSKYIVPIIQAVVGNNPGINFSP